ncbi:polyhydroxyalkanoic acid system family protein [Photobacterium atrarenae]|uniref:Polyhydroxyalkanoic acid system family protein n=1 Tax=Photobacterium atrarenae TaxID=865757 RepID=A0ABY5GIU8_9GAMM|nr:polyhydroxyalkanoic acid system family protein [Photobacterium atrarenae]UTV29091.1 polyhydroxyalkanoic acid system family protein [Photobacterium atrarenae]
MTIFIERNHDMPIDEITALSEQIAEELEQEYGLSWSWQGNRLMIRHASARGFLLSEEGKVTIELKLGFAASLFSTSIESHISERLDRMLLVS